MLNTPQLWLDVATLPSVNVGSIVSNAARNIDANSTTTSLDAQAYPKVGAEGLGDIDISTDGTKLYVMNLFEKALLEIDIASKSLIGSYSLPDPGCTNGTNRPFAVKYYKGNANLGTIDTFHF